MTTTTYPATAQQIAFLNTLIAERVPSAPVPSIETLKNDKRAASATISYLLGSPKKPRAAAPVPAPSIFDNIPLSKYAVAVDDIMLVGLDLDLGRNDLLFIEVRKYKGHIYMNKLTGAPGWFTRRRVSPRDAAILVKVIEPNAERYAKRFSEAYKCCACCLAELTDATSRDRGFGPICAKRFGY